MNIDTLRTAVSGVLDSENCGAEFYFLLTVGDHVQHEALQVGSAVLGVAERDLPFEPLVRNVLAVHAEIRRVDVKIDGSMEQGGETFEDETLVENGDVVFAQVIEKTSHGVVVQMLRLYARPDQALRREVLEELGKEIETALDEAQPVENDRLGELS